MADAQASPPPVPASARDELDAELRALYSALPVGVAFLDPQLRYQRVNEALARHQRPSGGARTSAPRCEEVLGEHRRRARDALRTVLARPARPLELQIDVRAPARPGRRALARGDLLPGRRRARELLGVGGVVRDVTERRLLERRAVAAAA